MAIKTHKRKKSTRMHGRKMGTHGTGARKMKRKSGHRGGNGMAGSGKRADHKKTLITKLYGSTYFGKKGVTSRGTQVDKSPVIKIEAIVHNLKRYGKKTAEGFEVKLEKHKILLGDRAFQLGEKLIITARAASKSAIEKIQKAGGKIELPKVKEKVIVKKEGSEKPGKEKAPEGVPPKSDDGSKVGKSEDKSETKDK